MPMADDQREMWRERKAEAARQKHQLALEKQRYKYNCKLENLRSENLLSIEEWKDHFEFIRLVSNVGVHFASILIKSLVLVNGGAVIALLSYIGHDHMILEYIGLPIRQLLQGLTWAMFSAFFLSLFLIVPHDKPNGERGEFLFKISAWMACIGFFICIGLSGWYFITGTNQTWEAFLKSYIDSTSHKYHRADYY
jgi:hypothetical protein